MSEHYCIRCNKDITEHELTLYDASSLSLLKFYGFCLECQRIVFENND